MKKTLVILGALVTTLAGLGLTAPGCVIEETIHVKGDGQGGGAPAPKLPGQKCGCDADCAGDDSLCFFGMCAKRAQGFCAEPNTEAGCEPGSRCFNSDVVTTSGVCLPPFDAATCEHVENRHALCSPTRLDSCDATCGSACVPDVTHPATPGAACATDTECGFHANAACYTDVPYGEPNGWVEGYCLAFGCTGDAECGGADKGCLPAASDGSGVCMNRCGMDLDCRAGYVCRILKDDNEQFVATGCFAGCDAAATCPSGYACVGDICVDEERACGEKNPNGWCPDASWCDAGTCNEEPFACDGSEDALEPNDSRAAAVDAPMGETAGLTSCTGDEDWYRVVVPEGKIARVGIKFKTDAGDIDLVAYDGSGTLLGSRIGEQYPYSFRDQETDTEYYGFYAGAAETTYFVRVVGYASQTNMGGENVYALAVDHFDYADGATCTGTGFTSDECIGQAPNGAGLLPFPFPDPNDGVVGGAYMWDTFSNYRFARRELIVLVRHALAETAKAFPDTKPLGLIDTCQIDGITPGYDVGDPRHPESTHDQGGNQDLAYFQTDGDNSAEIICGDGSQHADGFCSAAATQKHKVDLPRQAFFMGKLMASPRTRVIGVDQIIAPLIVAAAKELNKLPSDDPKFMTSAQLAAFNNKMAYGSGWPYHHHHIHLSMQWWSSSSVASPVGAAGPSSREHTMHDPSRVRAPYDLSHHVP